MNDARLNVEQLRVADSFFSRFIGLMGKSSFQAGEGLLLTRCKSVHTCFMRFPIDIVFLNDESVVIHAVHRLAPWRFTSIVKGTKCVLELPAGTVEKASIRVGERLSLPHKKGKHNPR